MPVRSKLSSTSSQMTFGEALPMPQASQPKTSKTSPLSPGMEASPSPLSSSESGASNAESLATTNSPRSFSSYEVSAELVAAEALVKRFPSDEEEKSEMLAPVMERFEEEFKRSEPAPLAAPVKEWHPTDEHCYFWVSGDNYSGRFIVATSKAAGEHALACFGDTIVMDWDFFVALGAGLAEVSGPEKMARMREAINYLADALERPRLEWRETFEA